MEDRFTEAISAWPQIKQANYKRKKYVQGKSKTEKKEYFSTN